MKGIYQMHTDEDKRFSEVFKEIMAGETHANVTILSGPKDKWHWSPTERVLVNWSWRYPFRTTTRQFEWFKASGQTEWRDAD